jgi:hypothetical protein
MVTHHSPRITPLKSPTCVGFRGPTSPQLHTHPHNAYAKIPHHCANFALSDPEDGEERKKAKNRKSNLLFPA